MSQRSIKVLILSIALFFAAVPALAEEDPPSRAARLAYINGSVSFQPGGVEDWALATVNRPLTTADRVWTDKDSRAEISFGSGLVRMGSETSVTLTNVSDNTVQLELHQGTLNVHVRRLEGGEIYEVDTPNVAFMLQKGGDYRIDVDPDGDTTYVTVRKGEGEGTGNGPSVRVRSGDQVAFSGGNSLEHRRRDAPDRDGFDDWCHARDERQDRSVSARYVPPDMVGYEDLDDYGGWDDHSHYGPVWYPRVNVGWSPYRHGHWAWVEPWGWTWVDDAPWGFAPFHYGRWVYVRNRWGWCPGPRPVVGVAYVRPVYAPALVAFIGGDHFRIGVSFGGGGGVGWVPLGWGEPYYPSYRVSPVYVRNVNVTNTHITNITHVTNNYTVIRNSSNTRITNVRYVNQNVPGAVTAVSRTAFATGQPVSRTAVRVSRDQISRVQFDAAPQVAPDRKAVLGGRAPVENRPPAKVFSRPVISRTAQPPAPVRFEDKAPLLQRTGGRPLTAAETNSLPRVQRTAPRQAVGSEPRRDSRPGNDVPQNNRTVNRQDRDQATTPRAVPRPPQSGVERQEGRGLGATTNRGTPRIQQPTEGRQEPPRRPERTPAVERNTDSNRNADIDRNVDTNRSVDRNRNADTNRPMERRGDAIPRPAAPSGRDERISEPNVRRQVEPPSRDDRGSATRQAPPQPSRETPRIAPQPRETPRVAPQQSRPPAAERVAPPATQRNEQPPQRQSNDRDGGRNSNRGGR